MLLHRFAGFWSNDLFADPASKVEGAPRQQRFSHSTTAEVIWTIIPIVILLIMAIPSAETLIKLEDARKSDLTVVITAYQWKWHYEYKGKDVSFYSSLARNSVNARRKNSGIDPFTVDNYLLEVDNRLVLPLGAKVRILVTSSDVIHAWWVPDLAIKKDAVPGFMNEAWFKPEETGIFRGQCAELCGMDHGYMPIVVEVVEADAWQAWPRHTKTRRCKSGAAWRIRKTRRIHK